MKEGNGGGHKQKRKVLCVCQVRKVSYLIDALQVNVARWLVDSVAGGLRYLQTGAQIRVKKERKKSSL